MEKNRITVEIYGNTYNMVGLESVEHMRLVAKTVDRRMRELKSKNPSLDSIQLAVLTAVNAVNEQLLLEEELRKLKD
ncbi:cell division protein ZapA [Metalysinibacillus jejuensis]|uniref:cell division protein ZapA n=1 Tax=Metalysinibacillus jejuensis TaxID=914327 RepID=UPI003D031388